MPTSATGASSAGRRRARGRGLSLVELLVVMVIVAAVASAVLLSLAGRESRQLERAAERARVLVEIACERAALTGRDVGISLVEDGLRFGYLVAGSWQPVREDPADPLRPRPLGEALVLSLAREGEALAPMDEPVAAAQLGCFASGELTPFELRLAHAGGGAGAWRLSGAFDGSLELERDDDAG